MAWLNIASTSADYRHTDTKSNVDSTQNTSQYGTRTPILSDDYMAAAARYGASLSPTGANAQQRQGTDWLSGNLTSNPVGTAVTDANANIDLARGGLNWLGANVYGPLATAAPRQITTSAPAVAGQALAGQSAYVGDVTAQTGAENMARYQNPWDQAVVDASLNDFYTTADRQANAMRAARGAGSAFGDRANVSDQVFNADVARGAGTLSSGLRREGFNTAAGFGMTDASRALAAAQGNQSVNQQNNQFNAGLLSDTSMFNAGQTTQNNQFNAGLLSEENRFNVGAGYQGDAQRLEAARDLQNTVSQITGLSQDQLANVITANGINMDAANALLAAGTITQDQLAQIVAMASAGNGYQFTQNTNEVGNVRGSSNTDAVGGGVKFGI